MKKTTALKIYGTATELAVALGITQQAVSKWPDEVPNRHVERLRELRSMGKAGRAALLAREDELTAFNARRDVARALKVRQ